MNAIARIILIPTLVFCLALVATANEEKKEAAVLLKDVAAAQKHPDREGLAEALNRVAGVHNGLEDKALRKKLQTAVGKVLQDKQAGSARPLAATVLGRLDDPEGSYKQLSKVFPKPKDKEATPAQIEALKATAGLAPEAAIPTLLKLIQKGKSLAAVKEAIVALGNYAQSKKRVAILKEVLDVMARHLAAAEAKAKDPKGGTGDRPWKALGASLIASANKLTGRDLQTAQEWLDTYKEHKKKLAALFPK